MDAKRWFPAPSTRRARYRANWVEALKVDAVQAGARLLLFVGLIALVVFVVNPLPRVWRQVRQNVDAVATQVMDRHRYVTRCLDELPPVDTMLQYLKQWDWCHGQAGRGGEVAAALPAPKILKTTPVKETADCNGGRAAGGTGSISLDVSDFPFTCYLRQIQAKISERWPPPRAAAHGGARAIIMFEVGRDGQIKDPQLERTSGNNVYDQSALRAVAAASPFPPLPLEFKAPSLRVHFGFEFQPAVTRITPPDLTRSIPP